MNVWINIKRQCTLYYLNLRERLNVMFRLKESHNKHPILLKIAIQQKIEILLNQQFEDAKRKKKLTYQWGNVGWQIESATEQSALITQWHDEEDSVEYFKRVLIEMVGLVEHYRIDENDESGYALGTVREIQNALIEMAKANQ
jgi:hypothetical protein|tara:strand:- start:367 stop:795 length:429 start_codon:yes stop_codon:yes gene_type:complete